MRLCKVKYLVVPVTAFLLASCTSAPKDELPSTANPKDEIEKLSTDLGVAVESNVDVLARKEYQKSVKYLDSAKAGLAAGNDQEKIINDLRFAKQSLRLANAAADNRKNQVPSLFNARQYAIKAGASRSSKLKNEWNSLDEDISDRADKLDKISPEDLDKFQARYVELEKKAVIESQLGKAAAQINGARKSGAAKSAPEALRKSEISLKNAESLIGSNVSYPSGYNQAVELANNNSQFLTEVVEVIEQNGKKLSEEAASKIVLQKRQISGLKKDLSTSEGVASETAKELDKKSSDLDAAQTNIAIQTAIEKSRSQFSDTEAETYQQGENLLIRLKSMNFRSGRAELPIGSIGLLAKVSAVAKSLNPKEIRIEGHTDSIGTSSMNMQLSEKRASSVATYLKANGFEATQISSEGHGFENPIATNKSPEGRAKNRRVDIIISPAQLKTQ